MEETEYNHEQYMEDVATNLRDISHSPDNPRFFISVGMVSMDGLLNSLTRADYPCLVAEKGPDKRLIDNLSDNKMYQPFFTLFILLKTEPGNDQSVRQARDNAEIIAEKIVGKLLYNSVRGQKGLSLLDEPSIRIQGVGPLGDNAHGVMLSFTIRQSAKFYYDADDWYAPE
jgi:hypothetical protein